MAYYMYCPLDLTVKQQHIYTLLYNQSAFKDNYRVSYTVQQLTVDSDKCFGMTERIVSTIIKQLILKGYLKEVVKGKKGFATVYEIQVNYIINGDQCVSNVSPMCNQSVSNSEPIPTVLGISGNKSVSNVYVNGNQCVNPIIKDKGKSKKKNEQLSADVESFFETCWDMMPRKIGKGSVSDKSKINAFEMGDTFVKCINAFKKDMKNTEQKFIPHGSTFFNSRYIDYVEQAETQNKPRQQVQFIRVEVTE